MKLSSALGFFRFVVRIFKKLVYLLFLVLNLTAKYGIIALLAYVLSTAAKLEYDYMKKYANAYSQMVREHDRQLLAGKMIDSQSCWERQGEVLQSAYLEEKSRRNAAELNLRQAAQETYYILRILEQDHPEVFKEIIRNHRIPADVMNLFREFDEWYGDQFEDEDVDQEPCNEGWTPFIDIFGKETNTGFEYMEHETDY